MRSFFVLFILILSTISLRAQMFSVGGDSGPSRSASSSYLRVGIVPVDFKYTGNQAAVSQQNRLDFNSSGFLLELETLGLNASAAFINKLTGSDNESYLNLSLEYINRFAFLNSSKFALGSPVGLRTNLVGIENEREGDEFSQTVLAFALGGFAFYKPSDKISFYAEGLPSYGFSSSQGGFFGGSNKSLTAKGRINLLNIFPGRSLSFGYDYTISSYDLDGEEFDYDLSYHSITIGLSL